MALRNSTVATIFQMAIVCKFPVVLCINLSMFSECKITLNFYSEALGFNYSTSNNLLITGVILISLRINYVLLQTSPLHKMLIPKIIADTVFYSVNSYTISQFQTQE